MTVTLTGEFRQIFRFLDGGIAAADHGDMHIPVKGCVAGAAIGDAFATEFMLAWNIQGIGPGAGTDNKGITADHRFVFQEQTLVEMIRQVHLPNFGCEGIQIKTPGMGGHFVHQIETRDPFRKTRIIVDPVGEENLTTGCALFDQHVIKAGTGGIEAG